MSYTSVLRIAIYSFALYANYIYARFLLNPAHAENLFLYVLAVIADVLTITVLSYTWISCLFFELSKGKYYSEIERLTDRGQDLAQRSVAVLVPTVNESLSLIRKTLTGTLAMRGNKTVYLLDDRGRGELKILCDRLGVVYIRRPHNQYNKAGNLNYALQFVNEEFVAVFDADFVPRSNFLIKTLPLFVDETIGIVQTPQVYHNENTFFAKGFKHFQDIFYSAIMPAKSLQNSAVCVGTNVVYRKNALDAIGGIPLVDHSEDINTSLKMYEKNYRTFYLDTQLARGLSPDNAISFFNQQFRWAKGGLSMFFKNNTLFNGKLNWDQRLQFFFSNMFYLTGLSIFIYLITPLLAIIFNSSAINPDYFYEWLNAYTLFFLANFIFYSLLIRKNLLQSVALGIFCFVPYTKAINAVLFNRRFQWKATNTKSSDIVTKLVAPFFPYLITSGAIAYLFFSGFLTFQTNFLLYAFWIGVNSLIIFYLIINCYASIIAKSEKKQYQALSAPVLKLQTS
jgi:cellulose synthase (UDP-forming)